MGRALRRTETVSLGAFVVKSLGGASTEDPASLSSSLVQVIRYYLADQASGRDAWPYPSFLGNDGGGRMIDLRIDIDDAVWKAFSREAKRQGVATNQLLQHAVIYFIADRDAGRVTQRIVDDLEADRTS
jgi:hypothetical protein